MCYSTLYRLAYRIATAWNLVEAEYTRLIQSMQQLKDDSHLEACEEAESDSDSLDSGDSTDDKAMESSSNLNLQACNSPSSQVATELEQ